MSCTSGGVKARFSLFYSGSVFREEVTLLETPLRFPVLS